MSLHWPVPDDPFGPPSSGRTGLVAKGVLVDEALGTGLNDEALATELDEVVTVTCGRR